MLDENGFRIFGDDGVAIGAARQRDGFAEERLVAGQFAENRRLVDFAGTLDVHIDFLESDDVWILPFDKIRDALQIHFAVHSFAVMDVI